jgi:hypothetical protein
MSAGVHKVVIYVHKGKKQFTVTARKQSARLPVVDQWAAIRRFARIVVAEGLEKQDAEAMKHRLIEKYSGQGYSYQERREHDH